MVCSTGELSATSRHQVDHLDVKSFCFTTVLKWEFSVNAKKNFKWNSYKESLCKREATVKAVNWTAKNMDQHTHATYQLKARSDKDGILKYLPPDPVGAHGKLRLILSSSKMWCACR